jgi:NADPH:quinone reductase-like Zn-dependent oxidoreductase
MKAWTIQTHGPVDGLAMVEQPQPEPAASEVLVRVRAASLNYRDLITLQQQRPGNLPPPLVPCSDGSGEVVAVGAKVTRFKPGDRVSGTFFRDWIDGPFDLSYHNAAGGGSIHGWLREFVTLPEHGSVQVTEHLTFEEAATLPCAAVTAWQALFTRGGVRLGETVLVLGTGGVSIFALQFARAIGAHVIVTSSSDAKLERAKQLGAWATINYRTTPEWDKEVWRLTEKRGVDHVVEVGGPGTLGKSANAIAANGRIALIGVLTGFGAPDASLFPVVARNARIDGIYVGSRADFEALNNFIERHWMHPVIDRVFAFGEAREAFAHLQSANHFGKLVVRIGE